MRPPARAAGAGFLLTALLLAFVPATTASAQGSEAVEPVPDRSEIRALREQTESSATLDADSRAAILALLDDAAAALKSADHDRSRQAEFERELAGMERRVASLRAELDRPTRAPGPPLGETATVGQAETRLARERARLGAYRNALVAAERLARERAETRNSISRQLGELDQQIELLDEQSRETADQLADPETQDALRIRNQLRKLAAGRKAERFRAELALLNARGELIPLQIDQARARVAASERLVAQLEAATFDLRRRDAAAALKRIREQAAEARALSPLLDDLAVETEALADALWGADGVVTASETTAKALLDTRRQLVDLKRIIDVMRRKFEVFGYQGSIARWWPKIPEDFPRVGSVASSVRDLERRVPEVEFALIRFEEQRRDSQEYRERLVAEPAWQELDPQVQRAAAQLLDERRELLDELTRRYARYSNQLVELETVSRFFLGEIERVTAFLYEQLLWVRSVPKPIVPLPADIAGGVVWFFSPGHWSEASRTIAAGLADRWIAALSTLAALGVLVSLRGRMRRRMETLAERALRPEEDRYRTSLEALVHTALLAAPLPVVLIILREGLTQPQASTFAFAGARALGLTASIAAFLTGIRQLTAPYGLAGAHFGWPERITRRLHRGITRAGIGFVVLMHIALHLMYAGVRLTSPEELQRYHNAFGRIAFVAAMAWLGAVLVAIFRPRLKTGSEPVPQTRSFVYVYPVAVISTIVPAVMATLGYYVSGLLLAYQMLRTLWLLLAVLVLGGMLFRWRTVSHASKQADEDRSATSLSARAAEQQVQRLFRFVVMLIAAIGLYGIWSESLPTLQILKRVQIWPTVAILEPETVEALAVSVAPVEPATAGEDAGALAVPGLPPGQSAAEEAPPAESSPLTLWKLLKSILAALVSIVLVKNIPGLLELGLQRRTRLDSGARIALGTLARYTVMILGVTISFNLLGISWSKIQWLVAALTFGLGFGLQEIVANFVSGLILLAERPVRVGDAVSIGNLQGLVSRIQIRATTITLWDRSEMIVPNKEFITSKLVNWTLSDSKRRIDIPLRVAYGADLDKVKEILLRVAADNPAVMRDPEPQALLMGFGDDAVKFELRVFVEFGQGLATRDAVHMSVEKAFRAEGIDFALPQLNLQVPEAYRRRPPDSPGE